MLRETRIFPSGPTPSGMVTSATHRARSTPALMVRATIRTVEPGLEVIEMLMSSSFSVATPGRPLFAMANPLVSAFLSASVVKVDSHWYRKLCATTAAPSSSLFAEFFFGLSRFSFFALAVVCTCLTSCHALWPRPTPSPPLHSGVDSMFLIVHTVNSSSGGWGRAPPPSSTCGGVNLTVRPPRPVLMASGSAA